ncbi:MAG: hypothetical protein U9Q83_09950 [Bacteroidota bacterium]|nr:hypothetical protein [Bacteroidota bacterium]
MKTTDQLIQGILTDFSTTVPDLITKLDANIEGKNTELKDILDITRNLKDTMETFVSSIDKIKDLSEFITISKETNVKLEEISKELENVISVVSGLNEKINETRDMIVEDEDESDITDAIGEEMKSGSSKKHSGNIMTTIVSFALGAAIMYILSLKDIL